MTYGFAARLAAVCAVLAFGLGAPAGAQMKGPSSSQHESGATACNGSACTEFVAIECSR